MSFFLNLFQQTQINQTKSELQNNRSKLSRLDIKAETADERIDRLSLACQALWEVLEEKGLVSRSEFIAKIEEVDLRDGRLDGKNSSPTVCPSCSKKNSSARLNCIYCGSKLAENPMKK